MQVQNKLYPLLLVVFGALCFFPIAMPTSFEIDETRNPLFLNFPAQIGQWSGEDAAVDEKVYEILETRNVLSRLYKKPSGESVHLLLVSSNKDRRVAHPPEVCYLGSNYTITDERVNDLNLGDVVIPAKEFIAKSERHVNHEEQVMYFYKVNGEYTTSYYSQQIRLAMDHLSNQSSEIMLIRVSSKDRELFEEFLPGVLELIP